MPMNFPNMSSLMRAAEIHKFRAPKVGETEDEYRARLADHVTPIDGIEGHEIRTGKGWNEWDDDDKESLFIHILKLLRI